MATKRKPSTLPPDVADAFREYEATVRSMITPAELGAMLGITGRTVQRRARAREWPHHRVPRMGQGDGAVMFTPDDVRMILDLLRRDRQIVSVPATRRKAKAS